MTTVHVVVPEGIDDPARPSGGNVYDRRICHGLVSSGWTVHEHAIPGDWPQPDPAAFAALATVLGRIPDDALVLLDGLVASTAPDVLVSLADRLRLVVLVHMPLGHRPPPDATGEVRTRESAVLRAAAAVVTTSPWSRRRLLELYSMPAARVHVAEPGVDAAELAPWSPTGDGLVCVAAVTFEKGHDTLIDALAKTADLAWRCLCVGSLDRDVQFVASVRRRALDAGVGDRVTFSGPRTGPELDRCYATADLMLLPSRAETYGMVVTEALARSLPIIATDVGGVSETLGHGADGKRPGLLVPAEDPAALAAALRAWLADAELRTQLRQAARERRETLCGWSTTISRLADVLARASR